MKTKNLIIIALFAGFVLTSLSMSALAARMSQEQEKQEQAADVVIIPEKVKSIFKEGINTREALLDIPFSMAWHSYLPARQNVHCVFFFKMKNADLGFVPVPQAIEITEEEPKEKKEEAAEAEEVPALLQASGHVFLQFSRMENNIPQEVMKEVYIPINFQIEGKDYDPEKEEFYSASYPLPAGDYLLSMAVASLDLERIGTQYFEFSLPDAFAFTDKIDTTPIFFIKNIRRMEVAETRAEVHKDFFTYSVLQIEPNVANIFSMRDNLDIFFFVYGVVPGEGGKHDIDVGYEVYKGEEKVIRYATAHYDAPLISQPLPLKKTVVIKSEAEGEKKEQRDLEAGQYTLQVKIDDKVSGKSIKKSVDFEVKQE